MYRTSIIFLAIAALATPASAFFVTPSVGAFESHGRRPTPASAQHAQC